MVFGPCYDLTGTVCRPAPRAGSLALAAYAKARWGLPLVGIYNCRQSTGGSGLSRHAIYAADDLHVHLRGVEDPPLGDELTTLLDMTERLREHADELGIQRIIRLDREWDSRPGQREWLPYTTGLFHGNHAHVELCEASSWGLTAAVLHAVLDPIPDPTDPPPPEDDMQPVFIWQTATATHFEANGVCSHVQGTAELNNIIEALVNAGIPTVVTTLEKPVTEEFVALRARTLVELAGLPAADLAALVADARDNP